jgi:hypothetical protein
LAKSAEVLVVDAELLFKSCAKVMESGGQETLVRAAGRVYRVSACGRIGVSA